MTVEGVKLSRSEMGWQIERQPIHGYRIVDNTGRLIVAHAYNEEIAEQIVNEHTRARLWSEMARAIVKAHTKLPMAKHNESLNAELSALIQRMKEIDPELRSFYYCG